jgi:hypothetical protein
MSAMSDLIEDWIQIRSTLQRQLKTLDSNQGQGTLDIRANDHCARKTGRRLPWPTRLLITKRRRGSGAEALARKALGGSQISASETKTSANSKARRAFSCYPTLAPKGVSG